MVQVHQFAILRLVVAALSPGSGSKVNPSFTQGVDPGVVTEGHP